MAGEEEQAAARRAADLFRSTPLSGQDEDAAHHETVVDLGKAAVNARKVAELFPADSVARQVLKETTRRVEDAQDLVARE